MHHLDNSQSKTFYDFPPGARQLVQPKKGFTFNGMPAIRFTSAEVDVLSRPYAISLIGNFTSGVSAFSNIQRCFKNLKLKGVCIKLNVTDGLPEEVILFVDDSPHVQSVYFENLPDYCATCLCIDHVVDNCSKNPKKFLSPPMARENLVVKSKHLLCDEDGFEQVNKNNRVKSGQDLLQLNNPLSSLNANPFDSLGNIEEIVDK